LIIACSPLWDTCDEILKDKFQINRAAGAVMITGARYDDRMWSSDLLEGLGWDSLHVRWAKLKSILMYKVLNENYSPCLRESLVRLRELNRGHNLRNQETDLALPKPEGFQNNPAGARFTASYFV
jgi:hypothetical protein